MTDVAQGSGWWLASDGRWYPPHLHPAQRAAPGPRAPGWWLASDGRWYPPEVRSDNPAPPANPPARPPSTPTKPADGRPPAPEARHRNRPPRRRSKGSRRRDALVVLGLLVVVLGGSYGIALAKEHHTSPSPAASRSTPTPSRLRHTAQVKAFDQLVASVRHDIGPCVQQTETVGTMLGILKLLGGASVTQTQITQLLGALSRAEAACSPATDPALQQLSSLRVPSSLARVTALNYVLANAYAWSNAYNPHVLNDVQALVQATTTAAGNQAVAAYDTDVGYANGAAKTVRNLLHHAATKLGVTHFKAISLPTWSVHSSA